MYFFIWFCFLLIIKDLKNKSFHFHLVTFLVIITSPLPDAASSHGPVCAGDPFYGVRHLVSGFAFFSFG